MLLCLVAFFATYGSAAGGTKCDAGSGEANHIPDTYTPRTMNAEKSRDLTLSENGKASFKLDTRTSIKNSDIEYTIPDPSEDDYQTDIEWLQGEEYEWGGSCECPSGETYQVAARKGRGGSCGNFYCTNGVSFGVCNMKKGPWSHNKVTCKTKKASNPHATGFTSISKLFEGYNILLGNPLPFDENTDPGFKAEIFKTTYDRNEQTKDLRFWVPDNVDAESCEDSCSLSMQAEVLRTELSYHEVMNNQVKWDTSVGTSASIGPFSFGFSAAFSGSRQYQVINEGYSKLQSQYVMSTATCCSYEFEHKNGGAYSTLDDEFVKDVLSLPLEYDETAYGNFVDTYGTHYVKKVKMGAKYVEIDRITTEDMASMEASHTNVQRSAEANACFGIGHIANVHAGGGRSSSHSTSNQNEQGFHRAIAQDHIVTLGARPPSDVSSGREWTASVINNPQPIQVELGYIPYVLSDTFHSSYMIDPKDLARKKANLETFLSDYCRRMKDEGKLSRDAHCRYCIEISGAPSWSKVNGIYTPHNELSSGGQETWINEDWSHYLFWNEEGAFTINKNLNEQSAAAFFLSKDRVLPSTSLYLYSDDSGSFYSQSGARMERVTCPRYTTPAPPPPTVRVVNTKAPANFALVDGGPGSDQKLHEKYGADPNQKLGEVQCCLHGQCTRMNPWNKRRRKNCISGYKDDSKFTLWEAKNMCASFGWSLCTRAEVDDKKCNKKGCGHDSQYVWVLENTYHGCIPFWNQQYDPLDYGSNKRSVEKNPADCAKRCKDTEHCIGSSWWWDGGCHLSTYGATMKWSGHGTAIKCFDTDDGCLTLKGQWYDPQDYGSNERSVEKSAEDCAKRCLRTEHCIGSSWWWDGGCHLSTYGATLKWNEYAYASKCFHHTVEAEQAVADEESEAEMGSGDYESSSSMVNEAMGSMATQQFVKLFALIGCASIMLHGAKIMYKSLCTSNEEFHQINDAEC